MNKGDLIEAVASKTGVTKAAATRTVDAMLECITEGVKTDDNVTLVGFGTFSKKNRPARTVRNPATGEPIDVAASTTIGFKPSKSLKEVM